jgi:hypothetical protein
MGLALNAAGESNMKGAVPFAIREGSASAFNTNALSISYLGKTVSLARALGDLYTCLTTSIFAAIYLLKTK